jgi:hypothetical protein
MLQESIASIKTCYFMPVTQ